MKKQLFLTACLLVLVPFLAHAADHAVADNTRINQRDRVGQTITPLDQSNTKSDLDITQTIRKSVMQKSFSMDAKNIKIITRNGVVTLRGPVKSSAELDKIAALAHAVPGVKSLDNQLQVK